MLLTESQFPNKFDSDANLLLAIDSLSVKLGQDYNPGDVGITAESSVMKFPPEGIITLIDSCDPENITSLYYEVRQDNYFAKLTLTPGSGNSFKSKLSSVITHQLDALHHNNIKDAIFKIEGVMGTTDDETKDTLFGRLNRLKKVAHAPRAWFDADKNIGMSPLTVQFTSSSSGTTGPVGKVTYTWDFGDGTKSIGTESSVTKTYFNPAAYTVTLEVTNSYGVDQVTFHDFIKVKSLAPDRAVIDIIPQQGQSLMQNGGLRATLNQFVVMKVLQGENPTTPGISYGGEILDDAKKPLDPIAAYTWQNSHGYSQKGTNQGKLIYDSGGLYDIILRTDTKSGAFRISSFPSMIDVIEPTNLWLWMLQDSNDVSAYEYGLTAETFKVKQYNRLHLHTNDSFLQNADQKEEFMRNNLFLQRDSVPSGFQGEGILLWASGRNPEESPALEDVMSSSFNPFLDTYSLPYTVSKRPWNWAGFAGQMAQAYLIFGGTVTQSPNISLTNETKSVVDFNTREVTNVQMHIYNYTSGSQNLRINSSAFSRYRTTWKNDIGYMVRSEGLNNLLKSFYKTDGTIGEPFINIVRLIDLPEPSAEGHLLELANSVCFLNDKGNIFNYSDQTNSWEVSNAQSTIFHGAENTGKFLAISDKDSRIYISFEDGTFVKYNALDSTYTTLGKRPTTGKQWLMNVF